MCRKLFGSKELLRKHKYIHQAAPPCHECGAPLNVLSKNTHKCRKDKLWERKLSEEQVSSIIAETDSIQQDPAAPSLTIKKVRSIICDEAGDIFKQNQCKQPSKSNFTAVMAFCEGNNIPTRKRDEPIISQPTPPEPLTEAGRQLNLIHNSFHNDAAQDLMDHMCTGFGDAHAQSFTIGTTDPNTEETVKVREGSSNRNMFFHNKLRTYKEVVAEQKRLLREKESAWEAKKLRKKLVLHYFS